MVTGCWLLAVGSILQSDNAAGRQGAQIKLNIVVASGQVIKEIVAIAIGDFWTDWVAIHVSRHRYTLSVSWGGIEQRDSHTWDTWLTIVLQAIHIVIEPNSVADPHTSQLDDP